MLALAILSSVLAGSYSITNRALRISQASQDRVYGLKLLAGQVEMMRRFREIDSAGWFNEVASATSGGSQYCFDPSDLLIDAGSINLHTAVITNIDNVCGKFGPSEDPLRFFVANRAETVGGGTVYVFRVEWQAVNGGGETVVVDGKTLYKDHVEYRYKLNELAGLGL
jgi:hypothetical protein